MDHAMDREMDRAMDREIYLAIGPPPTAVDGPRRFPMFP
jgi:hypothetical protein